MRILYLDVGGRYMNATSSFLPAMFRLHHEAALFGPGLCTDAEIEAGLDRFVEKHGDFDFVVSTQANWEIDEKGCAWYHRYMYPRHSNAALMKFGSEATAFLRRTTIPRIITLTNRDVYSITQEQIDEIDAIDGHYLAWARGFIKPQVDLDRFKDEQFYARRVGKKPFGLWYDFAEAQHHRFINLGHFIGFHEFDWRPIERRSQPALVPGVLYVRRAEVKKKLEAAGLTRGNRWFNRLISMADHAGLRPFGRPLVQQVFNMRFINEIADTRYAYTDGSGFEYPIRKFFEIPALGTVLLCTPCAGFTDLGFVDGKNAVSTMPETVVDTIARLEREPEATQAIADAGRQLMWDRHSIQARAEQVTRCLEAIKARSFGGSVWRNGEFVVETTASTREAQSA